MKKSEYLKYKQGMRRAGWIGTLAGLTFGTWAIFVLTYDPSQGYNPKEYYEHYFFIRDYEKDKQKIEHDKILDLMPSKIDSVNKFLSKPH